MIANMHAWRDLVRETAAIEGEAAVLSDCLSPLALLAVVGVEAILFVLAFGDIR